MAKEVRIGEGRKFIKLSEVDAKNRKRRGKAKFGPREKTKAYLIMHSVYYCTQPPSLNCTYVVENA